MKLAPFREHVEPGLPPTHPVDAGSKSVTDADGFPVPQGGHRETMTAMTDGRPHMLAVGWSMPVHLPILTPRQYPKPFGSK
jgi:hypothetical protein